MKLQGADTIALTSNQFAIIKLGKVAGKVKYSLLDVCSLWILDHYVLQAHLHIDPNGLGAAVYVKYYLRSAGAVALQGSDSQVPQQVPLLHELLWCHYFGSVPPNQKVAHKNGITVDNRLENLQMVPSCVPPLQLSQPLVTPKVSQAQIPGSTTSLHIGTEGVGQEEGLEKTLYYQTIKQLTLQVEAYQEQQRLTAFNAVGDMDLLFEDGSLLYECHYAPCCSLEQEYRQFRICGQCRRARYCSTTCQRNDWLFHKLSCVSYLPPNLTTLVPFPDR